MTGDAQLRGGSALALAELREEQAIEPLIDTFLYDEDPMVRKRAARALGDIGDRRALEALIKALEKETMEPLKKTIIWAIDSIKKQRLS